MINFRNYSNVTEIIIPDEIELSLTNFSDLFNNMTSLRRTTIPNSVTNMFSTYYNCFSLIGPPVCGNNVTDMRTTYYNCRNLTGSPVCGPNVTNM